MTSTPAAQWREEGKEDPFGHQFNCERAKLCKGSMTDDQLANAVFLSPDIGNLTAAKERIRWLSRELHRTTEALNQLANMAEENGGLEYYAVGNVINDALWPDRENT